MKKIIFLFIFCFIENIPQANSLTRYISAKQKQQSINIKAASLQSRIQRERRRAEENKLQMDLSTQREITRRKKFEFQVQQAEERKNERYLKSLRPYKGTGLNPPAKGQQL